MIIGGEKWHYLSVKSLLRLLQLKLQNHDYCYIEMPEKDNNTLEYNHGEKSLRVPFVIYLKK